MISLWTKRLTLFLLCSLMHPAASGAFGTNYTHPEITEAAIIGLLNNGLDQRLRHAFGLRDGIIAHGRFSPLVDDGVPDEEIERNNQVAGRTFQRRYPTWMQTPYTLQYLLISGSEAEDHPTERAQHHFHDPISNQGLDNNVYGLGTLADFVTLFYPPARQADAYRLFCAALDLCEPSFHLNGTSARDRVQGLTSRAYPVNLFSWQDARHYLAQALTRSDPVEREHFLAMAFFALGHVVHLLEDMGVPAHVRNDFLWDHIVSGTVGGRNLEGFLDMPGKTPMDVVPAGPVSFPRLSDYWDRDDPSGVPGLAEYVNRNFLSEGTVFRDYPEPQGTGEALYTITAPDGQLDRVRYLTGRTTDGQAIDHLAAGGLLYAFWKGIGEDQRAAEATYLDAACYEDYGRLIFPKVVAYVSGLVQYFFRGDLAVIPDGPDGLRVKNLSEEPMTGGRFEVYRESEGAVRTLIAELDMPASTILTPGAVSDPLVLQSGGLRPPLVENAASYLLVYQGQLGEELGAVVSRAFQWKVVFATHRQGTDEVYIMNPDGSVAVPLIANADTNVTYSRPVVSPDGNKMVFYAYQGQEEGLYLMDLETRRRIRLEDGYWPSFAPDGEKIVFHRMAEGNKHDLWVLYLSDFTETRLTNDVYDNLYPAWSPDGQHIAYSSLREGRYRIVLVNPTGLEIGVVTQDIRDAYKPSWSPNGLQIAYERPDKLLYTSGDPNFINIDVLSLSTGIESPLTTLDATNHSLSAWFGSPVWSPDGKSLIAEFWETGATGSDILQLDAITGVILRNLTADSPADDGYPFYTLGTL